MFVFLMVGVVPGFKEVFEGLGAELPALTLTVLAISDWLVAKWYFAAAGMFAGFMGFKMFKKTDKGAYFIDKMTLKVPIFGVLMQKVALARFSRTFATLIRSGVPIMGTLDIVSDTAGNQAQCSSRYFIHDTQPPDLSCASLNVVGHTNPLRPYGTEEIGSLSIAYPSVSDNSGESLAALATVPGSHGLLIDYTPDYHFRYEGMDHDYRSHVTMTGTDSSGNAASCTFEVRILDEEAPIIDCYGALRIDAATTNSGRLYGTTEDGLLDMVRRHRPFASPRCSR